jgi:hypothetical protein
MGALTEGTQEGFETGGRHVVVLRPCKIFPKQVQSLARRQKPKRATENPGPELSIVHWVFLAYHIHRVAGNGPYVLIIVSILPNVGGGLLCVNIIWLDWTGGWLLTLQRLAWPDHQSVRVPQLEGELIRHALPNRMVKRPQESEHRG